MEPARVKECKNAAEQPEVHEEGEQNLPEPDRRYPRQNKADVHRNAAQLERKIPPVIVAAVYDKGQTKLFPDLTGRHCKSTYEKYAVEMETDVFYQNSHL